jgi:predicted MPP superfamily phosphohydrolase
VGLTRILGPAAGGGAALGAAALGYALWEAQQFTLRKVAVPLLPPGHPLLKVLHISDLHLTPGQGRKIEWVRRLAEHEPDLVVNTGDNLAHADAVPVVLDALGDLLDLPGVFVFGSNDYYSPTLRNPLGYLLPDNGKRYIDQPELPWGDLQKGFLGSGWLDLTNQLGALTVGGTSFAFAGVDDPHLRFDDLSLVEGPARIDADVRLGVAHAPYLRVLDQFARDGYDAIVAGHTHGGQVCLPGYGALTTNCDLDRARAKGLHRHPAGSRPGDPGSTWLHVSAGLGTSPYAPIRLACRPEATLLTLTPRSG